MRTVVKTSAKGRLYLDWDPMTRIPDEYLECVVYMYPSISAAEKSEQLGGTGFVVGVRGEQDTSLQFLYVVTNRHIIEDGNTTVRINTTDGRHDSVEYDERNWIFAAHKFDLAIYPVPELDRGKFEIRLIEPKQFVTPKDARRIDLGIGDDVFFMGRFGLVEGRARNQPTLRFGTIAQLPREPINDQEINFLVEARSIPGFSGSPVFTYITHGDRYRVPKTKGALPHMAWGPKLLGIDWGHIYDKMDAEDDKGNKLNFKVRSNSGLMAVVPVGILQGLLDSERVKHMRRKREREILASRVAGRDSLRPSAQIEKDDHPANDANPNAREDFTHLLNAAVKTRESKD